MEVLKTSIKENTIVQSLAFFELINYHTLLTMSGSAGYLLFLNRYLRVQRDNAACQYMLFSWEEIFPNIIP